MRIALLSLLGCISSAAGCTNASGEVRDDEAPVVIELFTSQGCSSCPPAEQLLGKLARDGQLAGRTLAPLAFHVDYWDDLGWADPFALPAWTERQRQYADALGDDRIYTPELVVAGRTGLVGSNALAAARAIAATPRQQHITATARWATDKRDGDARDTVTIEAKAPDGADVLVAIWQDGTRTKIPRGENAGATLAGDRVVRRLERVAAAGTTATKTIALDPSWHASGAVVFAQRPDRTIVGATVLPR